MQLIEPTTEHRRGDGGIAVGDVNNDGHKDVGYGVHHNYSGTAWGDQLNEVVLGDGVTIGPGCVLCDCQLAGGTRVDP